MQIYIIVKRVSLFKSSFLLRIQIKYTHELQFLIKIKMAFLIEKYIQQMREGNQAWLGLVSETDSILIKEKHQYLSKMSDKVSKNVFGAQVLEV